MNRLGLAAGVTGFLAVALGAFGAHGLEHLLSAEAKDWWDTATLYGLTHAVAALAVSVSAKDRKLAGWCFVAGAIVFAGSLYALALTGIRGLGAVTPIGGVFMLVGWALVAWSAIREGSAGER